MITPRLESGENVFETLREKFNALAEAVDQLAKLESASPLLDVIDTGAGRLIRWNGSEAEPSAAVSGGTTTVETIRSIPKWSNVSLFVCSTRMNS